MTAIQMKALQLGSALLLAIALALLLLLLYLQHELEATSAELAQATADKTLLQTDSNNLAKSLKQSNTDKLALVAESERLALQVRQVALQKSELMDRHQTLKNQLNQLLQDTSYEDAKTWRYDTVPNDVVRLLNHAVDCAQRARIQDSVCVAARGADARMPSDSSIAAGDRVFTHGANSVPSQSATGRTYAVAHR